MKTLKLLLIIVLLLGLVSCSNKTAIKDDGQNNTATEENNQNTNKINSESGEDVSIYASEQKEYDIIKINYSYGYATDNIKIDKTIEVKVPVNYLLGLSLVEDESSENIINKYRWNELIDKFDDIPEEQRILAEDINKTQVYAVLFSSPENNEGVRVKIQSKEDLKDSFKGYNKQEIENALAKENMKSFNFYEGKTGDYDYIICPQALLSDDLSNTVAIMIVYLDNNTEVIIEHVIDETENKATANAQIMTKNDLKAVAEQLLKTIKIK